MELEAAERSEAMIVEKLMVVLKSSAILVKIE